jgi:hypothetical protein
MLDHFNVRALSLALRRVVTTNISGFSLSFLPPTTVAAFVDDDDMMIDDL